MGCPFDNKCNYYKEGNGKRDKCLPCPKWEPELSEFTIGPDFFKRDITEIPLSKKYDYVLSVIRTLPKKQATILIQRHYLNYSREEIQEYHGFKSKEAVSNIIRRATRNVLTKLKWGS